MQYGLLHLQILALRLLVDMMKLLNLEMLILSFLLLNVCESWFNNIYRWRPTYTNFINSNTYIHGSVCHKYHFDPETVIHTQNVESFNNEIKYEIKKKKRYKK
ncbi:hypothetical protein DMUE_2772 [Dictyocoela muelleri]|nr:hypothetical protein DMUE_2772 [Dictyocoela muelleri]